MKKYMICIIVAGVFWGLMGLFVRLLSAQDFETGGIVQLRSLMAAICFCVTILIKDKSLFKIKLKDIWCFLGAGLLAMLTFSYCYYTSMSYISLSAAAILLYTAPIIVVLLSLPIFKEKITSNKIIAVISAFIGCCLVSGIATGAGQFPMIGILFGLGSGLCYALYSIFAKLALQRGYNSLTINFYACLLSGLGSLVVWSPAPAIATLSASSWNVFLVIATGVVTCYLPYLFYTYGLSGLETGKSSVLASLEPVVATLVGVIIFREPMTLTSLIGVILVISAIVILSIDLRSITMRIIHAFAPKSNSNP